jgi:hypothetical protein
MASHDEFLTQCGHNHDALLTAVVVDITAVKEAHHLYFSNRWEIVAGGDDSGVSLSASSCLAGDVGVLLWLR